VRGPEGEIPLFTRYECKFWKLAEQLLFSFARGMSLRSLQVWLEGLGLGTGCASTLGKVMEEKVQELRVRQRKPLHSRAYRALVLDGTWFKERKQKKKEVLLVALGVRLDGSFEVLDWSVAPSESSSSWEKLLNRIYQRGLQEVELVVADEAWGIWEALDTVYPEAKREVRLWILGEIWRECFRGKVTQKEEASERVTGRFLKRRVSRKHQGSWNFSATGGSE
jgi:transposase-like protein